MTVHEKLMTASRYAGYRCLCASRYLMVVIGSIAGRHDFFKAVSVMIFCAVLAGIILFQTSFRCPRCGKPISAVNVSGTIKPSSFPRYCSNCGLDLQSVDDNT